MSESAVDNDTKRKRFLWGIAIGWFSLIPLIYGCTNAFRGISEQKATGLGAVAGGIAEACTMFGVFAIVATEVGAIYLLVTSWSRGRSGRNFLSIITIAWSGLTLFLIFSAAWILITYSRGGW